MISKLSVLKSIGVADILPIFSVSHRFLDTRRTIARAPVTDPSESPMKF